MASIKSEAKVIVDERADEATWEDLMNRIYVRQLTDKGIADADAVRALEVDEVRGETGSLRP